ncbi:MAG: glycoside hydrolase [Fimbriimonadaceae bacterium]|nr:glycoside hydrolase [Fimbriimonadaceae bacterium]
MTSARILALVFAFAACAIAFAQWPEIKKIGTGGEPYVATDGTGNVYLTCHQPCQLFASNDWGGNWRNVQTFGDALGDLQVIAPRPSTAFVVYMFTSVNGLQVWNTFDAAKTMNRVGSVQGPYDREWLAMSQASTDLFLTYSDGYIGGPKSKGIFVQKSSDMGKTFQDRVRMDNEAEGSYAVDPYLTALDDGTLVGMWAASKDYNLVDAYRTAVSRDGGKSWTDHQTMGTVRKDLGDAQERWMLGGICGSGKNVVVSYYMDYQAVTLEKLTNNALVVMYRVSKDGGKTFGSPKRVTALSEFSPSVKSVGEGVVYRQTMPWMAADPSGKIHLVYEDNRAGQGDINGKKYSKWHVRYAVMSDLDKGFTASERVSNDYVAERPPLDFICLAADAKNVYATWVEAPNAVGGWRFSGDLWVGRKENK